MIRLSILLTVFACTVAGVDHDTRDEVRNSPWELDTMSRGLDNPPRARQLSGTNFVMSHDKAHNEREYRVFYDGVVGMETVMRHTGENDLYYRQVTDGRKLLKLVYAGRRGLMDCVILHNNGDMDKFLSEFLLTDSNSVTPDNKAIDVHTFLKGAGSKVQNATYRLLESQSVPTDPYASLADLPALHGECAQLHHRIKHALRAQGRNDGILFHKLTNEGGAEEDLVPRRVKRVKKLGGGGRSRQRRDALLMPDTMWCGAGSSTEEFEEVGESRETDRCCREHDHCPYYIERFSTNYNLFNFYFQTLSHCYCDEVFRTCLKTAGTDKAEMVGELFFDILNMKCFEFETDRVCVERSFWGSCTRYEEQPVAVIRGSLDWD